jgi:hypothetical protein
VVDLRAFIYAAATTVDHVDHIEITHPHFNFRFCT